jgi:glycosyltransferase involved in cell wall biosynthesis
MLSFVIPAHNEEQHIGPTVTAVNAAGRESGESFEVIVVDDASTDRTAMVAAEHGARVLHVPHRQIAASRNAGVREARGDVLFFVDADTLASPEAVRACLREIRRGAVGGEQPLVPLWTSDHPPDRRGTTGFWDFTAS